MAFFKTEIKKTLNICLEHYTFDFCKNPYTWLIENIRIIRDWEVAKAYWNSFCPQQYLFDEWEYRALFFDPTFTTLSFYAIFEGTKPVAMLPLQNMKHKDTEYVEFFGGAFMEYNRVFWKPGYEEYVPQLCEQAIEDDANLHSMIGDHPYVLTAPCEDPSYSIALEGLSKEEEILRRLVPPKDRSAVRKLLSAGIEQRINHEDDLDAMAQHAIARFGDDSWFREPAVESAFHALVRSPYETHILSLVIDGIAESVSLGVRYNDHYYFLLSSTNRNSLPSLGKFHLTLLIREAARMGATVFHAGVGDCGWKERWNLDPVLLYDVGWTTEDEEKIAAVSATFGVV